MRRVVFCSGKVYYDLMRARELNEINDVAIARVEQLAPFPFDLVKDVADSYPNAEVRSSMIECVT
jgi:2-oxoglutarate dehydrogenase E1 component